MQARYLMVDGNAKTNESTGVDGVNIPRSQCVFSSFGCHRADFDCGPGACCDEAKLCSRAPEVDALYRPIAGILPTWPAPCFPHKRVSSTLALQHDVFCTRLASSLVGADGELDPASYALGRDGITNGRWLRSNPCTGVASSEQLGSQELVR